MYLVFSDVDGTVLDYYTYSCDLSRIGLELLREREIPLILVSSKTLPEMRKLQKELNLFTPFVFENGGGICMNGENVEYIGMNIEELSGHLPALQSVFRDDIRILTEMTIDEVIAFTGLSPERALFSQQRSTSLPFVVSSNKKYSADDLESFNEVLNRLGVAVTKGGRFFHFLSMASNKGNAVRQITQYYMTKKGASIVTAGIGDSDNDVSMLRAVDIPIAVRKPDGSAGINGVMNLHTTGGIGPSGFTEAVGYIIQHIQLQEKS